MLDKLISAGASGAHALVFAGTGNGWNGNLSEQPQQLKEDDLSDLKVETLTPRHSKTIQQFYKNLDLQVFAIIKLPLEAFSLRYSLPFVNVTCGPIIDYYFTTFLLIFRYGHLKVIVKYTIHS